MFARNVIAHETMGDRSSTHEAPAAFQAFDRLRPHLMSVMGIAGFRALISRALALATAEFPGLGMVSVKPDGALEGLDELRARLTRKQFLECRVAVLAQVLGLIVAFIGAHLTSRLVGEIWPTIPPNGLAFDKGVYK